MQLKKFNYQIISESYTIPSPVVWFGENRRVDFLSAEWSDFNFHPKEKFLKAKTIGLNPLDTLINTNYKFPDSIFEYSSLESIHMPFEFLINNANIIEHFKLKSLSLFGRTEKYLSSEFPLIDKDWFHLTSYRHLDPYILPIINVTNCPNLEWLFVKLSNNVRKKTIENIAKFENLLGLELMYLNNFNIFSELSNLSLKYLILEGLASKFPIHNISLFTKLKSLKINSYKNTIDCAIFTELPDLEEIYLLNCSKVSNIEALLECDKLQNIALFGCKDACTPFLKEQFEDRNFNILEIGISSLRK